MSAQAPGAGPARHSAAADEHRRRRLARVRHAMTFAAARDFEAGIYLQDLLVSAVVAILLTRLFLGLTGFPRMGGGGLHVAHMLWGGLLMLIALVLLLAVIGKRSKRLAALIGGAGFGLFIDELGKFITAENDYFFQPTIALIYGLLVLLFLSFRAIERRSLSPDEALANSADMLRELVLGGATEAEIQRTLRLLERSEIEGPLADGLRQAIAGAARASTNGRPRLARAAARAWRFYDGLIAARRGQLASLATSCVSMARTVGARVAVARPGDAVLARPARCGGGTRLEPSLAWCAALRDPPGRDAGGDGAGECYAVSARNRSTAVTRRSTAGC